MAQLLPEAQASERIGALLTAAGWTLQDYDRYDPAACRANHLARDSGGGWTRRVFAFHRPERLAGWLDEPDTSRSSLLKRAFEGRLS